LAAGEQLQGFFATLVDQEQLASLTGFENEEFFFPGIANVVRYCAMVIGGVSRSSPELRLAFYIRNAEQIGNEARYFTLTREQLRKLNPTTRTCPIFRTHFDAELTLRLYDRFPILRTIDAEDNSWGLSYLGMFHMANDSNLFLSEPTPHALPLYEAKLFWHYDHRFGSYELKGILKGKGGRGLPGMPIEKHQDPYYRITPQDWVDRREVDGRVSPVWNKTWLLAYRTTSSAKLERTLVATVLPYSVVNHKAPIMILSGPQSSRAHLFIGCFNSIVLDYIARRKIGGTDVGYFHIDQLPWPTPSTFNEKHDTFIRPRVLELTFTAEDIRPFSKELGWNGPPFKWDSERRFVIQCELDAFYAHLYGLSRDEWLFILDPHEIHGASYPGESFRVLKEKEIAQYDEFRTKRICLQVYDALAESIRTGMPYRTRIDPPPADPQCCHPKPNVGILAFGSLINDSGDELNPRIVLRIKTRTPFPVEYGRESGTRGGAPTLVLHQMGSPVAAEILVLDDTATVDEATNLLWRRETRNTGGEIYVEGTSAKSVLVRQFSEDARVSTVLYTDFHAAGKIPNPTARKLAERAIHSVEGADDGKDGISYLIDAIKCGIETPLTPAYKAEILRQTNANSLEEALMVLKGK